MRVAERCGSSEYSVHLPR